jgi:hypothetical protein
MDVTRVNGKVVGQGRVPAAMSLHFTSNATFDIGTDLDSPVSLDYYDQAPFAFNGTIGTPRLLSLSVLASGFLATASFPVLAGLLDPEEKAAKSAAAKSTVGVGGRCSAGDAKDSAKRTAGIEDKGPLEKKGKDDSGPAKSAVKKAAD